jgi:hypothetical protein
MATAQCAAENYNLHNKALFDSLTLKGYFSVAMLYRVSVHIYEPISRSR